MRRAMLAAVMVGMATIASAQVPPENATLRALGIVAQCYTGKVVYNNPYNPSIPSKPLPLWAIGVVSSGITVGEAEAACKNYGGVARWTVPRSTAEEARRWAENMTWSMFAPERDRRGTDLLALIGQDIARTSTPPLQIQVVLPAPVYFLLLQRPYTNCTTVSIGENLHTHCF